MTYHYVPLDELTTPKDGEVLCDRWWIVDPEQGALFWQSKGSKAWSPQCNSNSKIVEILLNRSHQHCEIVHVEVAYVGRKLQDQWI